MQEVKFCVDCKHYKKSSHSLVPDRCTSPNLGVSLIDGSPKSYNVLMCRGRNMCGQDSKWWEPLDGTTVVTKRKWYQIWKSE